MDVIAKLAINFGRLLHALVKHLAPLAPIFVEVRHTEEITGLNDNLEGIAQIVGIGTYLFCLLERDRRRINDLGHKRVQVFRE